MAITNKELQFVDLWASKIPMPGIEYSLDVLKGMKECYDIFNNQYKNKEYNFIFSNGEEINFEILSKNLCHMLGIDYSNIKGEYFQKYREQVFNISSNDFSSYDLLEMILENAEEIVKRDNDISNPVKVLNYYKSGIKCAIYKKMSDFEKYNFAAINYDPGDDKYDYSKQKVLFVPSNEVVCPYFMMGIKISNDINDEQNNSKYCVTTLLAPTDPIKFFDNQEVIIPTQIIVSDNNNLSRSNATPEEKIQLLTMYKSIVNLYSISDKLNISADYESMLNDQVNKHLGQKKI